MGLSVNRANLNGQDAKSSADLMTRLSTSLSNDPHLTDVEFIELAAGAIDAIVDVRRFQRHLASCQRCAAELQSLREVDAIWDDPIAIARLEDRIGRADKLRAAASMAKAPSSDTADSLSVRELQEVRPEPEPWWRNAVGWLPLAPLGRGMAAMAAGNDTAVLEFPVHDEDDIVDGLTGAIQRRGDEYYARIQVNAEAADQFSGRSVDVVAVDASTGLLSFQRRIASGQFVLLGTKLEIANVILTARLLS